MSKYWIPTAFLVRARSFEEAMDKVYNDLASYVRADQGAIYEDFWTYEVDVKETDPLITGRE